ncbi:MAG: TIGR00282 family metallophosphoesterase [Dehalococcoidales bacterium]|nr:TIGR00282 family metallophosphoesterase [Dehalococcoidales bacterium]
MRILAIGDVIGKPGRQALTRLLPLIKEEHGVDFTIVNAENSAGGIGVTPETATDLWNAGADVLTTGNHVWAYKEILPVLDGNSAIIRPYNYPPGVSGRGYLIKDGVMVVNLIGRTFMTNYDCPFRSMDALLEQVKERPPVIIVDFHAEATSEKNALGRYLDGRVSAVLGTHTHVGTIDTGVLNGGTAYVTDIGMTGPMDSVIGDDPENVIKRFLTILPYRLSAGKGRVVFNAVLVDVDESSGKARRIERIQRETE